MGRNVKFIDRTVNWFPSVRRRLGEAAGELEDALDWIDWIGGDIGGINVSRGMNSGAKGALNIVEDVFFGHGN